MEENKRYSAKKYFIFKIQDLVNNSFHILEEKRMESILKYLDVCTNTYDELQMSLDKNKLKRSYEGLLEGLGFQVQNHPFYQLDLYKNDFTHLYQLIQLSDEEREKEIHNIHRNLVALKKKLEAENLIECYISCLMKEESFKAYVWILVSNIL